MPEELSDEQIEELEAALRALDTQLRDHLAASQESAGVVQLEELFEENQIDIFDLERLSVV